MNIRVLIFALLLQFNFFSQPPRSNDSLPIISSTSSKIVFDVNQNIDLIQIFEATVTFGGGGIDCISGDCEYKGYLSNKYPDEY